MNVKHILVLFLFIFLLFLGFYTWNERTGKWDEIGASVGLELGTSVLRLISNYNHLIDSTWDNYLDVLQIRQDNIKLQTQVNNLQLELIKSRENERELLRLRKLLDLEAAIDWHKVGARVLSWKFGPNNFLESIILSKGYYNGAKPRTPVITPLGLLGRVLKAGPYTSIALLITDPGSSVSVITSRKRIPGILQGQGRGEAMVMRFVKLNEEVLVGDILITSGTDLNYPKGIPVAEVIDVKQGADAMLEIYAKPIIDVGKIEEVMLLQNPYENILPQGSPVYSPRPSILTGQENIQ